MSNNHTSSTSTASVSSGEPVGIIGLPSTQTIGDSTHRHQHTPNQREEATRNDTTNTGMIDVNVVHTPLAIASSLPPSLHLSPSSRSTPIVSDRSDSNHPNLTKSSELTTRLPNSTSSETHSSLPPASSSSASAPIGLGGDYEMFTASSTSTSAPPIQHPNTFVTNFIPPTHLVESDQVGQLRAATATETVVAPVSGPTTSTNPIVDHQTSLRPANSGQQHTAASHIGAVELSSKHASTHPPSALPVFKATSNPLEAMLANLSETFKSTKINVAAAAAAAVDTSTSSSSSSSSSPSRPRVLIDTKCYCIVVDPTLFDPSTSDRDQYQSALSMSSTSSSASASGNDQHRIQLKQHCVSWLADRLGDPASSEVSIVYVEHGRDLHINFSDYPSMGRALASVPFLIQCSIKQQHQPAWSRSSGACGPRRHELPELIRMNCHPTQPKDLQSLDADIKAKLTEMKLDYTAVWSTVKRSNNNNNNNNTTTSNMSATRAAATNHVITISILPRHIQLSDLRAVIDRLHLKFDLWGGKLRVSVPNTPSLRRCGQCDTGS